MSLGWIRAAIYLAIAGVLLVAGAALRTHWVDVGAGGVQAEWDKQKRLDTERALQLSQQKAADDAIRFRNNERIADEDHRREQARATQLAGLQRTVAGLRDAIDKLDSDDLSAAAADPRVAAIAQRAITARALLGSCSTRYLDMAGKAQRLADQVAGLQAFAVNVCHAGGTPASTQEPSE